MNLDHDTCYQIIKRQDERYDGYFYTAVKSTGVYCRPICKVPAPKSENCVFYDTAQACEEAGFRPCLRCRPELAPEYSEFKAKDSLLEQLMMYFENQNYVTGIIEQSQDVFGISVRHIHRLFKESFGVSPIQYIQTRRLHRAKMLLQDTDFKISDIALLAGFGSVSQFNSAFKKHYQMTPSQMKKKKKLPSGLVFNLSYRPPYDVKAMLDFFKKRQVEHVEVFQGDTYYRTLAIKEGQVYHRGWISVEFIEKDCKLRLTIGESLKDQVFKVINLVKKVFDLNFDPNHLPETIQKGVRLPGAFSFFEIGLRAIIGQQITVRAAQTITGRLVQLFPDVETPIKGLNKVFVEAETILALKDPLEALGSLGVIQSRTKAIVHLSQLILDGHLRDDGSMTIEAIQNTLDQIKGVGPWTRDYILMRGFSWPDIFLISDIGVKHGLYRRQIIKEDTSLSKYHQNKQYAHQGLAYAENLRPYRSYLNIELWQE